MKMDFCMERVGLFTNMSCNLNCKLCAADAPYRRNFKDFSLEQQKKVISRFFEAVSYVKKIFHCWWRTSFVKGPSCITRFPVSLF